jgi:AcrR family transcriptional regulator
MSQAEKTVPVSPANPRLVARRAAFLKAGREVFEEKGFAATTLDDVIARSGGSRQTLYALFHGKLGLFEAIVSESCETIFRGLKADVMAAGSLKEGLEQIGTRYLTIVTSPAGLSLYRLIISEAPRCPELGRLFWTLGPGNSRSFLKALFENYAGPDNYRVAEPGLAADHFLEMLSGTIRMQCLMGLRPPPSKAEVKKIVNAAVSHFLEGCFRAKPLAKAS